MGTENIEVKVNVTDGGSTSKITSGAKDLRAALEGAATAASKIGPTMAQAAARQGIANSNISKGASPAMAQGRQDAADSNLSRGVGGMTGAAGRDFAAQAQGLGGLVHVYATFAANIFAVSAAFNALKEAMNTLHLQQGIDQLSATSGKNLSSLAGSLNKVTDGALSLKASLTSVANASAAEMTNSQILKMGEVAKKASQALGWDMADAMDRLTKGITKNRPQLLDELGIIVSANQIYQDYGRQIGKTALSLTAYEKKQAFANAVLQQGIDKFSTIDIPTNPFNKLEAAASNSLQSLLGLIDRGIGPIVKYLAESPIGLTVAMGGLASMLLKQAIPAIGAFRENAKRLADESFQLTTKRAEDAKAASLGSAAAIKEAAMASAAEETKILKDHLLQMDSIRAASTMSKTSKAYSILQKDPRDVTTEEESHLERIADRLRVKNKVAAEGYDKALENIVLTKAAYIDEEKAINDEIVAKKKATSYTDIISQQQRIADKASQEYSARRIASTWAENTQNQGFFAATKQGWKDLVAARQDSKQINTDDKGVVNTTNIKGLNNFQVATQAVVGTTKSAISSLSILASSMSNIFMIVGTAVAVFTAFDGIMSKAGEQQDAFNNKITEGASAVKTATDAIDFLAHKSKDILNIQSITAMTNAIDGLTTSMEGQVSALKKWQEAAGWWDKSKDWLSGIFGSDNATILAKNMGSEVQSMFSTLVFTPGLKDIYQKDLATLLNVDPSTLDSVKGISDAISSTLKKPEPEKVLAKVLELSNKIKDIDGASTAASKSFLDSMKSLDQELETITNKLQFKDGIGKLGTMIQDLGLKLTDAMANPIKAIEGLVKIANDPKMQALLSMAGGGSMRGDIQDLSAMAKSIAEASQGITEAEATIAKLKKDGKYITATNDYKIFGTTMTSTTSESMVGKQADRELTSKQKDLADLNSKALELEAQIFVPITRTLNEYGDKLITTALKNAVDSAELTKATSDLSYAQRAGLVTADKEYEIKIQEINLKEDELKASYALQIAIIDNTREMELFNANLVLSEESKNPGKQDPIVVAHANTIVEAITKAMKQIPYSSSNGVRGSGSKGEYTHEDQVNSMSDRYVQQRIGPQVHLTAAVAQLEADKYIAYDKRAVDKQLQINTLAQDWIKLQDTSLALSLSELTNKDKLAGGYVKQLANARMLTEIAQANNTYDIEKLAIAAKIVVLEAKNASGKLIGYQQRKNQLAIEQDIALRKRDNATLTAQIAKLEKDQTDRLLIQKILGDQVVSRATNELAILDARASLESTRLNQLKEQGDISETLYNIKTKELDLGKLVGANNITALQDANDLATAQQKLNDLKEKAATEYTNVNSGENGNYTTDGATAAATASISSSAALGAQAEVEAAQRKLDKNKQLYDLSVKQLDMQHAYIDLLNQQKEIQKDLVTLFGATGTALYDAIKAMSSLASKNEEYNKQRLSKGANIASLDKLQTKDQISSIKDIAGASKNMFAEKTVAYKVMHAVEKTAAAVSLALETEKFAIKIGLLDAEVIATQVAIAKKAIFEEIANAGSIVKSVPAIFARFMSWMGPWGIPAAIAAMATVGIAASGSSAPPAGFTAEEQQKVQGTGQSYVNGKLVNNGGGALGDSTKVSTAIVDGIARLEKINFANLDFDKGSTYRALIAIRDNTGQFIKALIASGITGAAWGTQNASSKSFLGFNSSSTSVQDKGVKIGGTVGQLASGGGSKQTYENITTNSSSFWGLFSDTSNNTNTGKLPDSVAKYVTAIFKNFTTVLMSSAETMNSSVQSVSNILQGFNIDLKASGMGLTGTDFANAVMAEIGIQLDKAAGAVFPSLQKLSDQFQQLGESTTDFVLRLVKDTKDIKLAFDSISKILSNSASSTTVELGQFLIQASGSLDVFLTNTSSFKDKFLTTVEQLVPVQAAVNKEFSRLGIVMPSTREGFKNLILGFKITDRASADTYSSLLSLSSALDQLYPQLKQSATAEELRASKLSQLTSILKLQDKSSEVLVLQRLEELSIMDNSLKSGQMYLYALQDEADIKNKLITAYDKETQALNGTISSLKSSVTSLNTFKQSMLTGTQSVLTPKQKYDSLKTQALSVAAIASSTTTNPIQLQAKNDAISALPGVASSFLEASRTLFASSELYTNDFNSILQSVSNTSNALTVQLTDSQKQLNVLTTNTTILDIIKINTKSTADLLLDYSKAQSNATQAQQGYSIQLNSLVHDMLTQASLSTGSMQSILESIKLIAPSLKDVTVSPPTDVQITVPPRAQAQAIQNTNNALTAQIATLTDQLIALRNDQQAQTGNLIQMQQITTNQLIEAQKQIAVFQNTQDAWNARVLQESMYA